MRAVTTKRMQALDRWAIKTIGIPSVCLMENAGRSVAEEVQGFLHRRRGRKVLIVAGIGNNGGDGFVVARHLRNAGLQVKVLLAGTTAQLTPDAALNLRIAQKLKIPVVKAFRSSADALLRECTGTDVVVDALFGTGLSRAVSGQYRTLIEMMNASGKPVIAIDVPSGLDGTTGRVWGVAVRARMTVPLAFPKKGLFIGQGPEHAGRVAVVDIGIPKR